VSTDWNSTLTAQLAGILDDAAKRTPTFDPEDDEALTLRFGPESDDEPGAAAAYPSEDEEEDEDEDSEEDEDDEGGAKVLVAAQVRPIFPPEDETTDAVQGLPMDEPDPDVFIAGGDVQCGDENERGSGWSLRLGRGREDEEDRVVFGDGDAPICGEPTSPMFGDSEAPIYGEADAPIMRELVACF